MDEKIQLGEAFVEVGRVETAVELAKAGALSVAAIEETLQAGVALSKYVEERTRNSGVVIFKHDDPNERQIEVAAYIAACKGMGNVSLLAAQGKLPQE